MIRGLFLWIGLLITSLLSGQEIRRIQLPVSSAMVFTNGAQVNMSGQVTLPAGKSRIFVEGISGSLVDGTLQATATGKAVILSIGREEDRTDGIYAREIQKQVRALERLKDSLERNKIHLEVLQDEKEILLTNRKAGGNEGVKTLELKQLTDFIVTRLTDISLQLYRCQKEIVRLGGVIQKNEQELTKIRERRGRTPWGVMILLESPAEVSTTLTLSYIAGDAGWYPLYDLRLPEEGGEARLASRAKVWQNTGVDWKNVDLILSSGNPRAARQVPVLYPYFLKNDPQSVMLQNTMNMALQRKFAGASPVVNKEVEAEEAFDGMLAVADRSQSMNTVDYTIKIPYSIPSGRQGSEVQIAGNTIPVTYEYIVVPRQSQEALLVAGIADFSSYNLLDGEITLYLGNSYRGTQMINREVISPIHDVLSLSMGTDKGIVVKRVPKQNFRKESGGMVRVQKLWETAIRNNKEIPVKIKIEDQYPLSQDDKIRVEDLSYTTENVTVDTATGKLTWTVELQPKQSISLHIGYTVRYPKDWTVNVR